jgi:hypothetical protein
MCADFCEWRPAGIALTLLVASTQLACTDPKPAEQMLPCDVDAVLQNVCQGCHTRPPKEGVPLSLVSYADTQLQRENPTDRSLVPTFQVMGELLRAGSMPQPPATITDEQQGVLLEWIDAGAPPAPRGTSCP